MTYTTTPWFEPHELPVRSGPYEVKSKDGQLVYSFFDTESKVWGYVGYSPAAATGMRGKPSGTQRKTWRGLIK